MSGERTRWGWHRLEAKWADRFVTNAGIEPGDLVIDIGAGAGEITRPLLQRGAQVIAVELHPERVARLQRQFKNDRVTVVRADAADLRLPRQDFRVVANPPFSITVALLRRLTAPGSHLLRADLIVPWHIADRWVRGTPPGAGRWRREFQCSKGRPIPRSAFSPPPPSGIAVLTIKRISKTGVR